MTSTKRGIAVTARDLALFASLSAARYLTVEALEWLHFPGWEDRYQRFLETLKANPQARYQPSSLLYSRLRRLHEAELVHRICRPVARAWDRFSRAPDLFALSERGALLLAEATGQRFEQVHYERPRTRSFQTLEHAEAIGRFYAALVTRLQQKRLQLPSWQGDHLLAKAYDRVNARIQLQGGSIKRERMAIIPDAAFAIGQGERRQLFFVEVDRGRSIESWERKLAAYQAYHSSSELEKRYGTSSFVVLAATTTERQRERLVEATAQVLQNRGPAILFTLLDQLHPLTIGKGWWALTDVKQEQRWIRQRAVPYFRPLVKPDHVFIQD